MGGASDSDEDKGIKKSAKMAQITSYEKNLLLSIVSRPKIKSVVENKVTNGVWKGKKEKAWDKVSLEFCADLGVNLRTGEQLKKAWENMKTRAKKKVSQVKRGRKETGGGNAVRDVSALTDRIVSAIPVQMNSLENDFDDGADDEDSKTPQVKFPTSTSQLAIEMGKKQPSPQAATAGKTKGEQNTSKSDPILKRKLVAGQEIIVQMEEALQEKRIKLLDLQIQYEERRIHYLNEEHELRMTLLRERKM